MSLKAVISIAGGAVGVGGVVTPVALWQTGYLGTTSQNSNSNTESTSLGQSISSLTPSREGNCEVVDIIEEKVFSDLGKSKDDYTTISCEKTDSTDSETPFAENWTGLFLNDLLISEGESFAKGMKFNLETKTITVDEGEEDEEYETTFTGNRFLDSFSVTGKWGGQPKNILGKLITEVTVKGESEDFQKIYLAFPPKK